MSRSQHIAEANRVAKSIPDCYSEEVKTERKLLVLAHIKKALRLNK